MDHFRTLGKTSFINTWLREDKCSKEWTFFYLFLTKLNGELETVEMHPFSVLKGWTCGVMIK